MLVELVSETAPRRVVPPAAAPKLMDPLPAATVRGALPSIVPKRLMFWLAAAVVITGVPDNVNALFNVTTPPAVKVFERAVEPPPDWVTAPVIFAAEERVKTFVLVTVRAPPTVKPPANVKALPVKFTSDVVMTAPLKVVVPVPAFCTIEAAFTAPAVTLFALTMVRIFNGVVCPTPPENTMFPPPAVKVRFWVPSTVLPNVILPVPFPVLKEVVPIKTRGCVNAMVVPFVMMLKPPPNTVAPGPLSVNPPSIDNTTPDANVSVPVWVAVMGPPLVVVMLLFTLKTLPVIEMPDAPFVLSAPLKFVVPLPALCTIVDAVIAAALTELALVIVNVPRRVVPPRAPERVMLPVPATSVKFCPPFTVDANEMLALFEVMMLGPVKLTAGEMARALAPDTVILAPIWTRLAFVKIRLVKGVVPPIAPDKAMVPPVPAFKVRVVAPLMVLLKLMFAPAAVPPAFVVSRAGPPANTTGPVNVMTPPAVVMLPLKLIAVGAV